MGFTRDAAETQTRPNPSPFSHPLLLTHCDMRPCTREGLSLGRGRLACASSWRRAGTEGGEEEREDEAEPDADGVWLPSTSTPSP